jgi:hypothetical protein
VKEKKEEDGEKAMEQEEVEVVHKKKRERKTQIKVTASHTNGLGEQAIKIYIDAESRMMGIDREARDRDNARNDLETYIYDVREKLSNVWAEFVEENEKESFDSEVVAAEDWLYDRFEDGTKVEFADKLVELKGKFANCKAKHDAKLAQEEESIRINAEPQQVEAADVNMESKVDDVD